ncbi:MAG: cysteine peptidase family C39 domain-containing protein, partial [Acidobacteriota bacterium]
MRRRLVPEVIQTSGMDCGPACLTALLRGHGIAASYGRLREACQTDVDGTSIDTVEEIARELGLDVEQIMVPVDHVLLPGYEATPSVAVTRQPNGATHFVVLWGRTLGRFQIMDPARGRRWVAPHALGDELYVHELEVPAADWREVAAGDELRVPLAARLTALGVADPARLIDGALVDASWRSIAALDAATRMVAAIASAGGLARGRHAARLVEALAAEAANGGDVIPDIYWYARATRDPDAVRIRGAVLVHVTGQHAAAPASPELAAALTEPEPRPW